MAVRRLKAVVRGEWHMKKKMIANRHHGGGREEIIIESSSSVSIEKWHGCWRRQRKRNNGETGGEAKMKKRSEKSWRALISRQI